MAISLDAIPSTLRVPFVYAEFSSERAVQGPSVQPYRILVIGQRLTSGTVQALTAKRVTSEAQAKQYFGKGSMLANMLVALRKGNSFTETVAIAVDDDAAGVAAAGKIAITGPATSSGTLYVYIGGRRVTVGVASGQAADAIATAVAAAINANPDIDVTAAAALGDVNLTAKHKGAAGNKIDVRLNYNTGEANPAGVGTTVTAMSGGTSNPDLAPLIAALGDTQYNVIAFPYTDAVSLKAIEDELASRWGPLRQIEGVAITADNASYAGLTSLGESRNSPHVAILPATGSPTTPWEFAATAAGVVAYYSNIDPARQFRSLALPGVLPPPQKDRFTLQERNLHLYDGISTIAVDDGGTVRFERVITTYKTNAVGADDPSYLDLMTPLLLGYLRYDFRTSLLLRYPRHKLANDGTRFGAGQAIITPLEGKAFAVNKFRQWEENGYVENAAQFKRDLICERNASDPNRLDWLLPPDLVNNFMVGGVKIAFLLQGSELEA